MKMALGPAGKVGDHVLVKDQETFHIRQAGDQEGLRSADQYDEAAVVAVLTFAGRGIRAGRRTRRRKSHHSSKQEMISARMNSPRSSSSIRWARTRSLMETVGDMVSYWSTASRCAIQNRSSIKTIVNLRKKWRKIEPFPREGVEAGDVVGRERRRRHRDRRIRRRRIQG